MWLHVPAIDTILISVHSCLRGHNVFSRPIDMLSQNKLTSILQITFSTYILELILMYSYANCKSSVRQHWFSRWSVACSAPCHYLNQCRPNLLRHICAKQPQGSNNRLEKNCMYIYTCFIHVYCLSVFMWPVLLKWIHNDITNCHCTSAYQII